MAVIHYNNGFVKKEGGFKRQIRTESIKNIPESIMTIFLKHQSKRFSFLMRLDIIQMLFPLKVIWGIGHEPLPLLSFSHELGLKCIVSLA